TQYIGFFSFEFDVGDFRSIELNFLPIYIRSIDRQEVQLYTANITRANSKLQKNKTKKKKIQKRKRRKKNCSELFWKKSTI
ncbi:MAG: hypothetical protein QMC37_06995, partial [Flavobacteriales bacterium]